MNEIDIEKAGGITGPRLRGAKIGTPTRLIGVDDADGKIVSAHRQSHNVIKDRALFGEGFAQTPVIALNNGSSALSVTFAAVAGGVANRVNFQCVSPQAGLYSSVYVYAANASTGTAPGGSRVSTSNVWEFYTDAPSFDLVTFSYNTSNNAFSIEIDDVLVARQAGGYAGSNGRYHNFDFSAATPARKLRKVRLYLQRHCYFYGVRVSASDVVAATPRRPLLIGIGDSYTADDERDHYYNFWQVLARSQGWDAAPSGLGSTGYLSTNGGASMTFAQRLAGDATGFAPDIIGLAGGINDIPGYGANTWDQAALTAAALATWQAALDNNKLAIVLVIGPWRGSSSNAGSYTSVAMCAAFKAAAEAHAEYRSRLFYLPTNSDPAGAWQFGSTSTGNFSTTVYGSADGSHVIEAGQFYLGRRAAVAAARELSYAA